MRKKVLGLVMLLTVLIVGLAFAAGAKEDAEKTKIVYLSKWNQGEVVQGIVNDILDGYMADNPNVEIDKQWAGREVNVKLMASIQADNAPDIYDEDPPIIENSLGKAGLAVDLLPYLKSENGWNESTKVYDLYPKGLLDPWIYDGKLHCFPYLQYISLF